MIQITQAQTLQDLEGILVLQQSNLPVNISMEEAMEQGFVTVVHDLSLLQDMNNAGKHTIAKDEEQIVGYCLTMLTSFRNKIPVLVPMFDMIDTLEWQGRPFTTVSYFVMGQTCVAKSHRGKGVFDALYTGLKSFFQNDFEVVVTEISKRNQRSLRAHLRVGFEQIHEYMALDGEIWLVVAMNLK
jgi:hypothetical protein